MAVLPTDGDAAADDPHRLGDQGRGGTNENIDVWLELRSRRGDQFDLREVDPQPVHFPISGDQRTHVVLRSKRRRDR